MFLASANLAHAFVFSETNLYNYSYPLGNWTYVPCETSYIGDASCLKFTGSELTYCHKARNVASKGVCTCYNYRGLDARSIDGCTANATHPKCLSGQNACKQLSAIAYILGVIRFVELATCVYFTATCFRQIVRTRKYNARCTVLSSLSILYMSFTCLGIYHFVFLFKYRSSFTHDFGIISSGIMCLAVIAIFFSLSFVFAKVVTALRSLKSDGKSNISIAQQVIIIVVGVSVSLLVIYLFYTSRNAAGALITGFVCVVFGLGYILASLSLINTLSTKEFAKQYRRKVKHTMMGVGVGCIGYVASMVVYQLDSVQEISQRTGLTTALRFATNECTWFCILYFSWKVLRFLRVTEISNQNKVAAVEMTDRGSSLTSKS